MERFQMARGFPARGKCWVGQSIRTVSVRMIELMLESLAQAEFTRFGNAVRQLRRHHVVINARRRGFRCQLRFDDCLLRAFQNLLEQNGFKLPAGLGDLLFLGQLRIIREPIRRDRRGVDFRLESGEVHRMISSACNAPACIIASKIAIMSRGVAPSAFKAEATFSTVGNSPSGTSADFCSVTSVVCGSVTTVLPLLLKGLGCETSGVLATLMTILPCDTAQFEMRIVEVATIVPVFSLMIIRAGASGVISRFSSRAMKSTG